MSAPDSISPHATISTWNSSDVPSAPPVILKIRDGGQAIESVIGDVKKAFAKEDLERVLVESLTSAGIAAENDDHIGVRCGLSGRFEPSPDLGTGDDQDKRATDDDQAEQLPASAYRLRRSDRG